MKNLIILLSILLLFVSCYNKPDSDPQPTPTPTSTTDFESPEVSITSPSVNDIVSGTVTIRATATDNVGVAQVVFAVNGVTLDTDVVSPYTAIWDADAAGTGFYALTATATDNANNCVCMSVYV